MAANAPSELDVRLLIVPVKHYIHSFNLLFVQDTFSVGAGMTCDKPLGKVRPTELHFCCLFFDAGCSAWQGGAVFTMAAVLRAAGKHFTRFVWGGTKQRRS